MKAGNGSFDYPRTRGTSGVALPDEGSLVNPPNNGSGLTLGGGLGGLLGGVGQLGGDVERAAGLRAPSRSPATRSP